MKGILNALLAIAAIGISAVAVVAFFRGNIGWPQLALCLGVALVLALLALRPLFTEIRDFEIDSETFRNLKS